MDSLVFKPAVLTVTLYCGEYRKNDLVYEECKTFYISLTAEEMKHDIRDVCRAMEFSTFEERQLLELISEFKKSDWNELVDSGWDGTEMKSYDGHSYTVTFECLYSITS